jgi:hypothetical protein
MIGWLDADLGLLRDHRRTCKRARRRYMTCVFEGRSTFLSPALCPVERSVYAFGSIKPTASEAS